jgi:ubiquinone/menaquinone biosynthesis C-methylase UbiE
MDIETMRADWNRRAKEDAHYYVAFEQHDQSEAAFLASARKNWPAIVSEVHRLEVAPERAKALEIGCGPGRLLVQASAVFGEVHGVDISEEMVKIAQSRLAERPNVHVHVGNGDNLSSFDDASCEFVYSFAVFQHIPSEAVVLSYLRECVRVLTPGGVGRLHLRGAPAGLAEQRSKASTWTGCHFNEDEVVAFCDSHRVELVSLSGQNTQYFWITIRKPRPAAASSAAPRVNAITGPDTSKAEAAVRGPRGGISLWLSGFPEGCSLTEFWIHVGELRTRGSWLSVYQNGAYQLNAFVPRAARPGTVEVCLSYRGERVEGAYQLTLLDYKYSLRITDLSDGIDLLSHQIRSGVIKVSLQSVRDPQELVFKTNEQLLIVHDIVLIDEATDSYEVNLEIPRNTPPGSHRLTISNSASELATADFEFAVR